jgi:hypothetical protein
VVLVSGSGVPPEVLTTDVDADGMDGMDGAGALVEVPAALD